MKKTIILCILSILSINAMEKEEKDIKPDYRNSSPYMNSVQKEASYLLQICKKDCFNYRDYINARRREAFDLEPKDGKEECVKTQIAMFSNGYKSFRPDSNSKKTSFEMACDHYETSYCGHYLKEHPLWIKNREEIREKERLAKEEQEKAIKLMNLKKEKDKELPKVKKNEQVSHQPRFNAWMFNEQTKQSTRLIQNRNQPQRKTWWD